MIEAIAAFSILIAVVDCVLFTQTQAMMISTQHLLPPPLSTPTVTQDGAPVSQAPEAAAGNGKSASDGTKDIGLENESPPPNATLF